MFKIKLNLLNVHLRMFSKTSRKIAEATQEKLVKVAIIGLPNAGKSTLINTMMDQRICPTSDKVHTTTNFAKAITNRHNSQIIVFDTPGLVTKMEMKKHKLDEKFVSSCRHSIQNSNLIGVLHDVSNAWTRNEIHPIIIDLLKEFQKIPSFLILNKIDRLRSKRSLLDLARNLTCNNLSLSSKGKKPKPAIQAPAEDESKQESKQESKDTEREYEKKEAGWADFKGVFMVSSLNGDGIEEVVKFIESQSVAQPWMFKNNEITDQTPESLVVQFVRARLLDYLPQEIPYQLNTELEYFSNENNKVFASVIITCPSERVERLLCGAAEGKLRQITDRITSDLIECFKSPVTLTLSTVVVKKSH